MRIRSRRFNEKILRITFRGSIVLAIPNIVNQSQITDDRDMRCVE
jgi:hypothetical protein